MMANDDLFGGGRGRQPQQEYNGKRNREAIARRWNDHRMSFTVYSQDRAFGVVDQFPQNLPNQFRCLYPPFAYQHTGVSLCTRFIRSARPKDNPSPVAAMDWQPDGKRLSAGYQNGEVLLWDGACFKFDIKINQNHSKDENGGDGYHRGNEEENVESIQELVWSRRGDYMITVDARQMLKVWQSNYDVLDEWDPIHELTVRQISFAPCDRKFASCSDDTKIKIWDLSTRQLERELPEVGSDMKTIDWHPSRALIAGAGKDSSIRFFDPRVGSGDRATPLSTVPVHKNQVLRVQWNRNGNHLLSCGKDYMVRIVDIRMMAEVMEFQGHEKDVHSIAWHPVHEDTFVSGGFNGEMHWWCTGSETPNRPVYSLPNAHKTAVQQLRFHPLGHVLASGGKDQNIRFWVRNVAGLDLAQSRNTERVEQAVAASVTRRAVDIPGLTKYAQLFASDEPEQTGEEVGPVDETGQTLEEEE